MQLWALRVRHVYLPARLGRAWFGPARGCVCVCSSYVPYLSGWYRLELRLRVCKKGIVTKAFGWGLRGFCWILQEVTGVTGRGRAM